jgi:hypothetical protein
MRKKRGRYVMALGLVAFLFTEGQRLRELSEQRTELQARRTRLEGEIRSTLTLRRLGPIVERRLGLRMPADSQIILLTRPSGDSVP